MAIGPENVRKGHLHGLEGLSHYLRRLLVRKNSLDAAAAGGEARSGASSSAAPLPTERWAVPPTAPMVRAR